MRLYGPINSGAAVQTAGAGTGIANATSTTIMRGKVIGVYVKYNLTPPASTDVIVKTVGTSPAAPTQTFLTLTDKNTDGLFMPRTIPHDTVGAALAALTIAEPVAIYDFVNVSIAGANTADNVDVWLFME